MQTDVFFEYDFTSKHPQLDLRHDNMAKVSCGGKLLTSVAAAVINQAGGMQASDSRTAVVCVELFAK